MVVADWGDMWPGEVSGRMYELEEIGFLESLHMGGVVGIGGAVGIKGQQGLGRVNRVNRVNSFFMLFRGCRNILRQSL